MCGEGSSLREEPGSLTLSPDPDKKIKPGDSVTISKGRGPKKIDFFLGKSPKLWVGGGQES